MTTSASKTMKGNLLLSKVRLSYPKLFKAQGIEGIEDAAERFGAVLLIPKEDKATVKVIKDEIARILKEKNKGMPVPSDKLFIHDGDERDDDGYAGCYYISANRAKSQGRPTVVNSDKTPLTEEDNVIYAGCYVDAVISCFFSSKAGKRVCAVLEIVRFVQDGEPFGSAREDLDDVFGDDDEFTDGSDAEGKVDLSDIF